MEDGEEDRVLDLLNDRGEDGGRKYMLRLVPILEDEEDERVVNLLVVNESGGSILAPCGGYWQGVIGAYRYPGCGAHMHKFCGNEVGEGMMVSIR